MIQQYRVTLADGLHAPGHARTWIGDHAHGLPVPLVDDALLLASELVTNAVRHGRPAIVLDLAVRDDGLRVAVTDTGRSMPLLPHTNPDPTRPNGRGLLIVAATAADWGVVALDPPPGKTVWVDLRVNGAG